MDYEPEVLQTMSALSAARRTVTGVCEKHKSQLPFAVTAPAVRLRAPLKEQA
ncbi:hypothetical protein [Halogeometricum sp. CBA1124]|uniref:hypothetical protein n=1 Tax=Halogeometricum sp. CBA1124 TaxID=2668071 RepID=UPI001E357BC8|nr:hypothetical protein [Halogeometricum sp. CBA1124]